MKRWINVLSQITLGAGQITNIALPIIGERYRVMIAVALGAASLIVSAIAHEFNTDGTPQTTPFRSP